MVNGDDFSISDPAMLHSAIQVVGSHQWQDSRREQATISVVDTLQRPAVAT